MTSPELFGPFTLDVAGHAPGVAVATLDRPPVNAFDVAAYVGLTDLVSAVESQESIKVLVLAAREGARCWCGGADLRDFRGMDAERRRERYDVVNAAIPRLQAARLPVIAAITGHAIGIGVLLAAAADLRVASEKAGFACPEVDFGLVAGSSRLLNYLGMPESQIREMAYTGRRLPASALLATGFLNAVTPPEQVLPHCLSLATEIAAKSGPVLRARKQAFVEHESMDWLEAYRLAQGLSGGLVALPEAREGVEAALRK